MAITETTSRAAANDRVDAPADAPILVEDVTMAFGSFVVQRDLNFHINRNDIFIIMGGLPPPFPAVG